MIFKSKFLRPVIAALFVFILLLTGCSLRDPSYSQMKDMLKGVIPNEGNCCDYSKNVQDYSIQNGYQCYIVVMNWKNKDGHVCVAFNTTDKGWIYIEPQNRAEVKVELGESYNVPGILYFNTMEDRIITQKVVYR
jgi:hypothetical protein